MVKINIYDLLDSLEGSGQYQSPYGYGRSAFENFFSGAGNVIQGVGNYIDQKTDGQEGVISRLGNDLIERHPLEQQYSLEEMKSDPVRYVTDPRGLTANFFNLVGSMAATLPAGGLAGGAAKGLLGAVGVGARAMAAGGLLGEAAGAGFVDASAEAGNTYKTAIDSGLTQQQATDAMNKDFLNNMALSTAQSAITFNLLRGVGNTAGKIISKEGNASGGLLGSLSEYGGRVAEWGDKTLARRLVKNVPSALAEGYTEGLQQEFQDAAITDRNINFNPASFSDEGMLQGVQATIGTLPLAMIGAVGGRRRSNENVTSDFERNDSTIPTEMVQPPAEEILPVENVNQTPPGGTIPVDPQNVEPEPEIASETPMTVVTAPPAEGEVVWDDPFVNNVVNRMSNQTEEDLAEAQRYAKGDNSYSFYQALASELMDNADDNFGYNPLDLNKKLTQGEIGEIAKGIIDSPNNSITDGNIAGSVAQVIAKRVYDNTIRNKAADLLTRANDNNVSLTDKQVQELSSRYPNRNVIKTVDKLVKEREGINRTSQKENISTVADNLTSHIEEHGADSIFYNATKDNQRATDKLSEMGVDITNPTVVKVIKQTSHKVDIAADKAKENLLKEAKQDISKNGVKSKFYMTGDTLETMISKEGLSTVKSAIHAGTNNQKFVQSIAKLSMAVRAPKPQKTVTKPKSLFGGEKNFISLKQPTKNGSPHVTVNDNGVISLENMEGTIRLPENILNKVRNDKDALLNAVDDWLYDNNNAALELPLDAKEKIKVNEDGTVTAPLEYHSPVDGKKITTTKKIASLLTEEDFKKIEDAGYTVVDQKGNILHAKLQEDEAKKKVPEKGSKRRSVQTDGIQEPASNNLKQRQNNSKQVPKIRTEGLGKGNEARPLSVKEKENGKSGTAGARVSGNGVFKRSNTSGSMEVSNPTSQDSTLAKAVGNGRESSSGRRLERLDENDRREIRQGKAPEVNGKVLEGYKTLYDVPNYVNKNINVNKFYREQFSGFNDKTAMKLGTFFKRLGIVFGQNVRKDTNVEGYADFRNGVISVLYHNIDQRTRLLMNHEAVHQVVDVIMGTVERTLNRPTSQFLKASEPVVRYTPEKRERLYNALAYGRTIEDYNKLSEDKKKKIDEAIEAFTPINGESWDDIPLNVRKLLYDVSWTGGRETLKGFIGKIDYLKEHGDSKPYNLLIRWRNLFHEALACSVQNDMVEAQNEWASRMDEEGLVNLDKDSEWYLSPEEMVDRIRKSDMSGSKKERLSNELTRDFVNSNKLFNKIISMANSENLEEVGKIFKSRRENHIITAEDGSSILSEDFLRYSISKNNITDAVTNARNSLLDGGLTLLHDGLKNKNDKLTVLGRLLKDAKTTFDRYIPRARPIYDLAVEAQRLMQKKTREFTNNFTNAWDGLSKKEVSALESAILYANDIHRDPYEVIKLSNGEYVALKYDGFRETFDDMESAATAVAELKSQGYKRVKVINDSNQQRYGYTVLALPEGSKLFDSENSAQKYADEHFKEALGEVFENNGHVIETKDLENLANHYKAHRAALDDAFYQMIQTKLNVEGKAAKVPHRRTGFMPHMHLPYVVYEKLPDGKWERTTSFFNASEARDYVKGLTKKGKQAEFKEISQFDRAVQWNGANKGDVLDQSQLEELEKEGVLNTVAAEENYSKALSYLMAPLFKNRNEVKVDELMRRLVQIKRRKAKGTDIKANTIRLAQKQIKFTRIGRLLARRTDESLTKRQFDEILSRATGHAKFNPHFLEQTDTKGYNRNVRDVTMRYLVQAANYISKAKLKYDGTRVYAEAFGKDWTEPATTEEQKFVKNYLQANLNSKTVTPFDNFMNEAIRSIPYLGDLIKRYYSHNPYTDFVGSMISLNNVFKLGLFNPSSAVVQLSQLMNANARLGGGPLGGSRYFRDGVKAVLGRNTEGYKELFDYIGIGEEIFAMDVELAGRPPGFTQKKIINGLSLADLGNKSMALFNWGDQTARKITAIGAYEKALDEWKKLPMDDRRVLNKKDWTYKWARDFVTDTNFDYSVANTPLAMTNLGLTGKMLLQFKKYPLFTLNFMRNNTKQENARFLAQLALFAGLMGMPLTDLADDGLDKLVGKSPKAAIKRAIIEWAGSDPTKKAVANVAMYGVLAGVPGINIQGRIGLQDAVQFDLGPSAGLIAGAVNSAQTGTIEPFINALASRPRQIKQAYEGVYKTSGGKVLDTYDTMDRIFKVMGFKPIGETNSTDAEAAVRYAKGQYQKGLTEAKKAYLDNPNQDNYQALRVYGIKPSAIRKLTLEKVGKKQKQKTKELERISEAAGDFTE